MKVYVLTSVKLTDGILISYEPQVFKGKDDAREMLRRIRNEEYLPEYVEIRGYKVWVDDPDVFTAGLATDVDNSVVLAIICTEMK